MHLAISQSDTEEAQSFTENLISINNFSSMNRYKYRILASQISTND